MLVGLGRDYLVVATKHLILRLEFFFELAVVRTEVMDAAVQPVAHHVGLFFGRKFDHYFV